MMIKKDKKRPSDRFGNLQNKQINEMKKVNIVKRFDFKMGKKDNQKGDFVVIMISLEKLKISETS